MFSKLFHLFIILSIFVITDATYSEGILREKLSRSHSKKKEFLLRAAAVANVSEEYTESPSAQAYLRTVNEESRFIQGYLFSASFTDEDCNEASMYYMEVVKLNVCTADPNRLESHKVRAWTTVRGNLGVTFNDWTGGKCQEEWDHFDFYVRNNVCVKGIKYWTGPFSSIPPSLLTGTVGIFQFSDNRKCLTSTDPSKDFDYAQFHPQNSCDLYIPEVRITGCDNTGVHLEYAEGDDTCTDVTDYITYNPKNTCLWYDMFDEYTINGWAKYKCY